MSKITKQEFDILYSQAQKDLCEAEGEFNMWNEKKIHMVAYYVKRFKKMEKNIVRANKNLISQQKRINAFIDLVSGKDITLVERKEKVKVAPQSQPTVVVDPNSGELISLSPDEVKNLLENEK